MSSRKSRIFVRVRLQILVLSLILAFGVQSSVALYLPPAPPARVTAERVEEEVAAPPYIYPNCRFGVLAGNSEELATAATLNVGWYLTFWARKRLPDTPGAEWAQTVRFSQDRGGSDICGPDYNPPFAVNPPLTEAGLGAIVDANPGQLWILGNEPDRRSVQDDICPQQYAQAYHDAYYFIKGRDPSAQIAMAGLVEVTPGRMQYLDIMWNSYLAKYGGPMPVDVWSMHIYILSESNEGDAHIALGTNPGLAYGNSAICSDPNTICHAEHDDMGLFRDQVELMRQWMKLHGQQDKPLVLTEFSVLKPYHFNGKVCQYDTCPPGSRDNGCFCDETGRTFNPTRVATFMEAAFDYMRTATDPLLGYPRDEYRLVQRWLWYRLSTETYDAVAHASNLANRQSGYALTHVGQQWQDYVRAIPPTYNLFPTQVPTAYGAVIGAGGATVGLRAEVKGGGNTVLVGPATVTFYSDVGLTSPIGSATFSNLAGCERGAAWVATKWTGLSAGTYPFWVKVDSPDEIDESVETDNVMQGWVVIQPFGIVLPLVARNWG